GLVRRGDGYGLFGDISATVQAANCDVTGPEKALQPLLPRPRRTRATAIEIKRRQAQFGVGVASQVRFSQEVEAGDTARPRKLMPQWLADHLQIEGRDEANAYSAHAVEIRPRLRATTPRIHQPFTADCHVVLPSFPTSGWERTAAKLCFAGFNARGKECCVVGQESKRSFLAVRSQAELGNELLTGGIILRSLMLPARPT